MLQYNTQSVRGISLIKMYISVRVCICGVCVRGFYRTFDHCGRLITADDWSLRTIDHRAIHYNRTPSKCARGAE